ncbi:MAG: hypothetical protein LAO55_22665 [Acidobacteriia bacterium]|nr:hypothetical protein [Terriglobia bacterium]
MKIARFVSFVFLIAATTHPALAVDTVLWDSSGNGLLNGTYNFREVMWRNKGDLHRVAIYGSIVFDGTGGYRLTSKVMDSAAGTVQDFSTTGAYRISASGMGFMDDPTRLSASSPSSTVWGLVSRGVFAGSSTDDGINNLFIAALAPASAPTNASFNGHYWAAAANFPSGDVTQARDMLFPLNPNGQGSLGTVNLTGFVGTGGFQQTVPGAAYSFDANGALTLGFGVSGPLIGGNELCYLSADGNFFFGGSATGWDMIVGVRAFDGSVPPDALNGLYYQAGADVKPSDGFDTLATYYGSFSATFDRIIIGHQRVLKADPALQYKPFDYTYSDTFSLAADGTHDDFLGLHNVVGAGGAIRIGFGNASRRGINVALKAPDFSGSGVLLTPDGIANAASSAPFTVGVSRGEIIALFGANLSSTTLVNDWTTPFSLGGVQVLINGRPAQVYFVRSDLVLAIVPSATTGTVASIQVTNSMGASDIRTVRVKDGTPGLFASTGRGVGYVIAAHSPENSSALVTPQNPARPGERIVLYLTGLGDVASLPAIVFNNDSDSRTVQPISAESSPALSGVYTITVTVPNGMVAGDWYVDVVLPDSRTSEAQISIGPSNLALQPMGATTLRGARPRERPAGRNTEPPGLPSR